MPTVGRCPPSRSRSTRFPLLSSAIDEPSAYELVRNWDGTGMVVAASGLAADAGEVGLGHASGGHVPSVLS